MQYLTFGLYHLHVKPQDTQTKLSAVRSILRLFVVLFKKTNLTNTIWCNDEGQNPFDAVHRSDIPTRKPNMHDARLSRQNASLNSLSVYFSNVEQMDLILISF